MLLFILIILLFVDLPWSIFYDHFGQKNKPVPFRLIDFFENSAIKTKHVILNLPLDKKVCSENLLIFNKIMNDLDINYWLSEGTALGVIRDNSFITWDDDVDVSFMYTYRDKFINQAIPLLRKQGLLLSSCSHYGNLLSFNRNGEKMDVDIVEKDGKCIAAFTKNAKYDTKCNSILPYLENMRKVEFLGKEFNVPGDDYLEYLYGTTWKTPIKK